jgi:peptidoglycan/xylan/chitin deacetylase (PgdA/CDA1 family)
MRRKLIATGFRLIHASRLDRLMAPLTQGLGAILMFHHVRPWRARAFAPNRLLEIRPEFFEAVIVTLRRRQFDIVSLDEALARLAEPRRGARPFAVLTFDDGYRDNREHALPILERHEAPFTLYVATGFAERRARLWWLELERALERADTIDIEIEGERINLPARTAVEKAAGFAALYQRLRRGREETLLATIGELAARHAVDGRALVEEECMSFDEIAAMAAGPLCTIGAHTLTHPMLAKHDAAFVREELGRSRDEIAARLGRPVSHVAYPVGDPTSAGPREFAIAREVGFASGVTTRPGMIFAEHGAHRTALPRLSINGLWQDVGYVEQLLSGVPFALWNGGRRLNVA